MEIEVKKDSKKIEISKNTIIIILAVALVAVSGIAICFSIFGEEHGDRGEYGRGEMMGQYQESGRYFGNNMNPNDAEVQDNQNAQINTNVVPNINTKPVSNVPVVPPVTTPKTQ